MVFQVDGREWGKMGSGDVGFLGPGSKECTYAENREWDSRCEAVKQGKVIPPRR